MRDEYIRMTDLLGWLMCKGLIREGLNHKQIYNEWKSYYELKEHKKRIAEHVTKS